MGILLPFLDDIEAGVMASLASQEAAVPRLEPFPPQPVVNFALAVAPDPNEADQPDEEAEVDTASESEPESECSEPEPEYSEPESRHSDPNWEPEESDFEGDSSVDADSMVGYEWEPSSGDEAWSLSEDTSSMSNASMPEDGEEASPPQAQVAPPPPPRLEVSVKEDEDVPMEMEEVDAEVPMDYEPTLPLPTTYPLPLFNNSIDPPPTPEGIWRLFCNDLANFLENNDVLELINCPPAELQLQLQLQPQRPTKPSNIV
jgi:hypothetical protein